MGKAEHPHPLRQADVVLQVEMARLWSYARKLHALELTYSTVPVWTKLTEAQRLEYLRRAARLPTSSTPSG